MIKELVSVANKLDQVGLTKEADYIDSVIRKLSSDNGEAVVKSKTINKGETLDSITREFSAPVGKNINDNMSLNEGIIKDPNKLVAGTVIKIWTFPEAEDLHRGNL
jgi:hypothetical protein